MNVSVPVDLGSRSYEVRIGAFSADDIADGIATALDPGTTGIAVLVDAGLGARSPKVAALLSALSARLPRVERLDLPAGEASKTLTEMSRTVEWLASRAYDRRAAIVGIGGGATTDHAGFAAAIYLRGIPFALVPTTLLAMVDASVGGKTGVDLSAGKNLVGAFHQPRAVIADVGFLETLPARERIAGLAEVVKCGFIADPEILRLVEMSRGRVVDLADGSVVVEVTGTETEIDTFVALVRNYGIKELVRTGAVVMARGSGSIEEAIKR